jgi:cation transport regulator ChaB
VPVEEVDPPALDHEEGAVAHALLVEHVAGLERAALAALGQPLQLVLGEAGVEGLVGEVREGLGLDAGRRHRPTLAERRLRTTFSEPDAGNPLPGATRGGDMPAQKEMPATLRRSPAKAQRTWAKTHDAAVEQYGEGERAHRTAFAAVKHSFEKVGDHWEPKDEPGPSDPQARKGGAEARAGGGKTYGGVDVEGNTKAELYERARALDIKGRSKMTKHELAEAIARKQ